VVSLTPAPDVKLEDVRWRVQGRPTNGRVQYVPYVDATTVARLLDEWVGPARWKDDYQPAHGKGMWGLLAVLVEGEWVWKKDVGVPSNMEAEKGLVSDAFKRVASIKWGVARNVYDLPTLWAPCDERANRNGEKVAYPNKDTLPSIIAELKRRGFEDAAAADATADHDDGDENEGGGAPVLGEQRATDAAPALATFDDHKVIRHEVSLLGPESKERLSAWWKQQGLPNIKTKDVLTQGQAEAVLSFLDELHEQREKRAERAAQVAEEAGLRPSNDPAELEARAKRLAEGKRAPKGPADRAAGDDAA